MSRPASVPLKRFRESLGLSGEAACVALGLRESSKGYLSRVETGDSPAGLRLALKIQVWSGGAVAAESLLAPEDADLLRAALAATPAAPEREGVAA